MNPNNNPNHSFHASLTESINSNLSIQTRNADFHHDGPPPNSPVIPTLLSHPRGSWLFWFPTEIRCMIWRELLVTTKVYISFTNCRLLMAQRGAKRKHRATRRVSAFDDKHMEYYGVLGDDDAGEEADVGTYFSPRRCHDDWAQYFMVNTGPQPLVSFQDSHHPRPHLDIFLACRLARSEAEPIFYSENCFTFCVCNQFHDYNAARDISAAHAAYCFFQDRSPAALREIKHIELHVELWPSDPVPFTRKAAFAPPNVQMWREMAVFIKSHMEIQRLRLNIGGWAPEAWDYGGPGNYLLRRPEHPEIDELLVLLPVQRLSIRWATPAHPLALCNRHTARCFGNSHMRMRFPRCHFAYETMAVVSCIKFIRDRLLAGRNTLGLSQIRGGLVLNAGGQRYESANIVMETDDSCNGASHLATQQVGHQTNINNGLHVSTSPRWPTDRACMEVVSDDFHESLRNSRDLRRPVRKEVTFHFRWMDCLTPNDALRALDCEEF